VLQTPKNDFFSLLKDSNGITFVITILREQKNMLLICKMRIFASI